MVVKHRVRGVVVALLVLLVVLLASGAAFAQETDSTGGETTAGSVTTSEMSEEDSGSGGGEVLSGLAKVDVHSIGDAVMAQGHYMCTLAATIDGAIADGTVTAPHGRTELYLAGYNAGEGAVLASAGFPTGHTDYVVQTRPYADKIIAAEPQYRAMGNQ